MNFALLEFCRDIRCENKVIMMSVIERCFSFSQVIKQYAIAPQGWPAIWVVTWETCETRVYIVVRLSTQALTT